MHKPHLIRFAMVNGRELTISVEPETGLDVASRRETVAPIESVRRAFRQSTPFPYRTSDGRQGFIVLHNVVWFEDRGEAEE